jgi:hypothetical protein
MWQHRMHGMNVLLYSVVFTAIALTTEPLHHLFPAQITFSFNDDL